MERTRKANAMQAMQGAQVGQSATQVGGTHVAVEAAREARGARAVLEAAALCALLGVHYDAEEYDALVDRYRKARWEAWFTRALEGPTAA